ncbi:DUF2163 domain-containing protein [Methylocystis iwaonis]|uniref:DUF2163 domain-containing protein n=1 Tax=Methylocystis iwaonis TaxID=2885079 RepID=UPI002E7AF4BB|nr:DUF2163 domain-containing protein [Methylocystis iwaonis]
MKTFSPALAAHLASGATTMCRCWRVTRRDGVVLGFTDHDRDLIADGTLFEAAAGFTASQIQSSLGLAVDNFTADGALSSARLTEKDILAGRYDDAAMELLHVNWSDPTQFYIEARGNLGNLDRKGAAFTAEFRSLAARLNQRIGQSFERSCSAQLGDARCGVNLALPAYSSAATTVSVDGPHLFLSGLSSFKRDWFAGGVMQKGIDTHEIKAHIIEPNGSVMLEFWIELTAFVAAGDAVTVKAGCAKNFPTCKNKFANAANFRGFPHIPPTDMIGTIANRGDPRNNGGSLLGN